MRVPLLILLCLLFAASAQAQAEDPPLPYAVEADNIMRRGMTDQDAYTMLRELCTKVGNRLSGSPQAAEAVQWGKRTLESKGFQNVHLEKVMVPHWVRGEKERALLLMSPDKKEGIELNCLALGGSPATPKDGVMAEVIEVQGLDDVDKLGDKVKGKIIFYNRPMEPKYSSTFTAYGSASDQRFAGPAWAAQHGAVAVLVRSMTLATDNVPHTGATRDPQVPCAAISTVAANFLSKTIATNPKARVRLTLSCKTLPDVESANVVGEIVGAELPNEVLVVGGHLDSWDVGQGAHDDGSGVVQAIEAVSLIQKLGLKPKRTIRVVLFMNEENGGRGGTAYAELPRPNEKHIVAIESDSGGFAPRGFEVQSPDKLPNIARWKYLLTYCGADAISLGNGGADISPLGKQGTLLIGLRPESQRYFDYHHAVTDTIDAVNPRELELGAVAMSILLYTLAQEGV